MRMYKLRLTLVSIPLPRGAENTHSLAPHTTPLLVPGAVPLPSRSVILWSTSASQTYPIHGALIQAIAPATTVARISNAQSAVVPRILNLLLGS